MKKCGALFLFLFVYSLSFAQHINNADKQFIQQQEDSLRNLANKIILGINPDDRLKADSSFTKMLMRTLKTHNSFYYPFDSVQSISILYAPDSSFKIFTWQLVINENVVRHHGVIQMKTDDGSLKRFPLIDKTIVTTRIQDTIGNNLGWIGAIYYKIIEKKSFNKNYYTLLGFDMNNISSDRKLIEVLTFVNDEPIFGGRFFSFEEDTIFKTARSRYIMEFKKDAGPRLTYDPDLDMIIAEHLISESGEPNKKWTYVGDGDYEGFKWRNGKWIHIEKVYHYVTPMGKEPVPSPLKDNNGNLLDDKVNDTDPDKPATDVKQKTKPVTPKKKKGDG